MSTPFVVHFAGVVPIPVGHEVEVRIFLLPTGVFSKKLEPQLEEPLIIDLDTQIVFGQEWHFAVTEGSQINVVKTELPLVQRADLREHGRWRGRVAATRIAFIGGGAYQSGGYVQTSISITPVDTNQQPYR